MANTVTITSFEGSGMNYLITFKIVLSGSYVQVASGGEVLNFLSATVDPAYAGSAGVMAGFSNQTPIALDAWSTNGNLTRQYMIVKGSINGGCKLKISAASSFGTEFAAGAYASDITSDIIEGQMILNKGI